ncbi:MAG: Calx-beta domain-containing protein, partial [Planctomycetota bacterium]
MLDWETEINPVTPRDPVIDCDVDINLVMGPRYNSNDDQSLDIESGTIRFWWGWRMGDGGSGASIVNITGGDVTVWSNPGGWAVRAADSGSLIWNQSAGIVTLPDNRFRTGDSGGTYSEFNISGGTLSMAGEWKWGDEGDVVLNMSNGSIDIGGHWSMHCRDWSSTDVNMTGGDIWVGGEIRAADSSNNTQTATIGLSAGTIDADSLLLPTQDEGTGILNMTGGSLICRNTLRVPNTGGGTGIINLDGGTIETANFYIDNGGILDVNDGILVINGNVVAEVLADVNAGYITAYNGDGAVIVDYNSVTNKTAVWAGAAVSFETSGSSGLETVSPAILTVNLYNPPEGNTVTVQYAATGGTAEGNDVDYNLPPGTLTFLPGGSTSQTIEISIINDGSDEDDETIEVTLSDPNNAQPGTITQHIYTILDPRPTVVFNTTASEGPESVSPAYIPVSLSWEWADTVTVDYNVTGGTAIAGEDY